MCAFRQKMKRYRKTYLLLIKKPVNASLMRTLLKFNQLFMLRFRYTSGSIFQSVKRLIGTSQIMRISLLTELFPLKKE